MFPGDWICFNVNTFYRECSGFPSFLHKYAWLTLSKMQQCIAMVPLTLRFWMLLSHFHFSIKWKTTIFLDKKKHLFFLKCSHLLPSPLLPAGENIKRIQKQWKSGETSRAQIKKITCTSCNPAQGPLTGQQTRGSLGPRRPYRPFDRSCTGKDKDKKDSTVMNSESELLTHLFSSFWMGNQLPIEKFSLKCMLKFLDIWFSKTGVCCWNLT